MDLRLQIKEQLKRDGRNIMWLAEKLGVTANHLRMVLRCERSLSEKSKSKIKEVWPEGEFYEDTILPHEKLAEDKEKAKNLFKEK